MSCSRHCDRAAGRYMVGASGILYACSAATAKRAMMLGAPTFQVLFIRGCVMLLSTLMAMVILRARGTHPEPVSNWLGVSWSQRGWLTIRAAAGSVTVALNIVSLQFLDFSDANALNFTWPVFGVLISFTVLRERVRGIELVGIAATVAGSILVARPSFVFGAAHAVDGTGILIALLGAFTMGWTVVLIRKLASVMLVHWTIVVLFQCIGQVVLAPLAFVALGSTPLFSTEIAGYSLATGGLASMHQILLTRGLSKERVGPAAAMQRSAPTLLRGGTAWRATWHCLESRCRRPSR